jgi:glucan phosphoethanolaminetransferase (alkaline phosphatase superfamily)
MNRKVLIGIGLIAGVVQAAAGVLMYLTGVYFAPWSMFVSLLLLLVCIVVGTSWYRAHYLNGKMTYLQALSVGIAISLCTGFVYAIYNMVSIAWFYPNFLDEVVRARMATGVQQQTTELFAALRADVSASGIAIPNLIRISVVGSILSLLSALFLKRRRASV